MRQSLYSAQILLHYNGGKERARETKSSTFLFSRLRNGRRRGFFKARKSRVGSRVNIGPLGTRNKTQDGEGETEEWV